MANILSNLRAPEGSTTGKKRLGRGVGSGLGKTSGRGQKGQYARTRGFKPHFEGGQTPMHRRLPKRGFTHDGVEVELVGLDSLEKSFETGAKVDHAALVEKGLISRSCESYKLLGNGEIKKAIHFVGKASKGAAKAIEAAGGSVTV
jgi:large subunit ribosomal protein L15